MFEKLNNADWKVLDYIVENPYKKLYLREISKNLSISPSSVKKALDILRKNEIIIEENLGNLRIVSGNYEQSLFRYIKIAMNMDKIRALIEKMLPASSIVLYGSYAKGENDEKSDIDVFIISNSKKPLIDEWVGKRLQIVKMTPAEWDKTKKSNHAYAEEIMRGILLHGEMPA